MEHGHTPVWQPYSLRLALLLAVLLASAALWAQADLFLPDSPVLTGLWLSDADWGDYDGDNDLDLIMVGYSLGGATGDGFMRFYRNDGNSVFTQVTTSMLGVGNGSIRFADLDGDHDLDVLLCGQQAFNVDTTRVYINTNGTFADSGTWLPPRVSSSIEVGDFDLDGDFDLLISGGTIEDTSDGHTHIYRNDGNFQFTQLDLGLTGVRNGHAAFGDYNGDGWLDIALAGRAASGSYITKIYKSNGNGTFTDIMATLTGLRYSRLAWVDYNCNGALDLIVSGSFLNESPSEFHLYRNDGNDVFTDVPQSIPGERQGDLTWGDINNDGYPDILINGLITNTTTVANLYTYDSGTGLYSSAQEMTYLKYACQRFGDYNNDNKLDLSLSGRYDYEDYWNVLYMNNAPAANTPPQSPTNLGITIERNDILLWWDSALDAQTPAAGLTYNLRVGTTPGGDDVVSAMANPQTGWRLIARPGNCWLRTYYSLRGLPDDTYYWSVQAIDNSFAGSAFAPEQSFTLGQSDADDPMVPVLAGLSIHPNPFRSATEVNISLSKAGKVTASLYNLKGQLVRTLIDADLAAGTHGFALSGLDSDSRALPSGIYTLRIAAGGKTVTRKITYIK
jgi:hypothetical protein